MLVQIIVIATAFVIALSYPLGIEPLTFLPSDLHRALSAASTIMLLSVLYVLMGISMVRRHINLIANCLRNPVPDANISNNIDKIIAHYYRSLFRYRLLLLLIYFIQVYIFHLPLLIKTPDGFYGLGIGGIPFIGTLLVILPFIATYLVSYIPFYWMERMVYMMQVREISARPENKFPALGSYLIFQVRTYFMLAVLPMLVFILIFEAIYTVPYLGNIVVVYPFIEWFLSVAVLSAIYLAAPFILKNLWVTEPLPQGQLRHFLQSISQSAGIKIRDFLIWKVGNRPFANVLIIGMFPFNRFIIFTDTVIKNLSEDEVGAVFAHEVGHAKFNHLFIYLLFAFTYLSIALFLAEIIGGNLALNFGASVLLLVLFWTMIFGYLSKRFELQADWFAARITGSPDSFVRALVRIARLNGVPFRTSGMSSLTHPSIEHRIASVRDGSVSPAQAPMMRRLMFVLVLLLSTGISGTGYSIVRQALSAPQRRLKIEALGLARQAELLMQQGASGSAVAEQEKLVRAVYCLVSAIKLDQYQPSYHMLLGDAFVRLDGEQSVNGRRAYEYAAKLRPSDPAERYHLSQKIRK